MSIIYTPEHEHFGIVPLEAMCYQKPVIACNSGGPRETVIHGLTGFLCESNPEVTLYHNYNCLQLRRAQSFARAMIRLSNTPKLAKEMGVAAKTYFNEHVHMSAFIRNTECVLQTSMTVQPINRDVPGRLRLSFYIILFTTTLLALLVRSQYS